MKCPACGRAMTEVQVQDITVDVCRGGCGGIWFDWMELKKVDEPHEAIGQELMEVERDPNVKIDPSAKRQCPRCENTIMMTHFASVKREVTVDECPRCAGFFLDYGELNQLRSQFATEEDRKEAAQAFFADLFDEGLADLAEDSDHMVEKSRGLARMFRFLLPSYYIPGKQKWGSF